MENMQPDSDISAVVAPPIWNCSSPWISLPGALKQHIYRYSASLLTNQALHHFNLSPDILKGREVMTRAIHAGTTALGKKGYITVKQEEDRHEKILGVRKGRARFGDRGIRDHRWHHHHCSDYYDSGSRNECEHPVWPYARRTGHSVRSNLKNPLNTGGFFKTHKSSKDRRKTKMDVLVMSLLCSGTVIGSVCDLRTGKIPNLLTMPVMLIGLSYHTASAGLNGLGFSAAGLFVGIGHAGGSLHHRRDGCGRCQALGSGRLNGRP